MALAGVAHVAHRGLADQLQRAVELQALRRVHARVGRAAGDQQRRARLLGVVDRAALEAELPLGPGVEPRVDHLVLDRDLGRQSLADLVADAHEHHAGAEVLGVAGGAPGGGVAAVGAAGDAHLVAVHQAAGDQVVHGVHEVVELLARRVGLRGLGELDAAPGGAPVVGVEDREAARRQHLAGTRVVGQPAVGEVGLGPAVDDHHQRHPGPLGPLQRVDQEAL